MDIAQQKGWFKEAGLNVEWVDTNPNYFASFDDLLAGKLDFVEFTFFDFVLYSARDKDLVGVLATDYSSGAEAVVAGPGIKSISDLAGKKVALSKGTYLEYLFDVAARRGGLDPASVTLVDVPGEKAPLEFLEGRADAFVSWEPYVAQGLAKTMATKLFSTAEVLGISGGIGVVRRQTLTDRPADVQALLGVWHRTTEFIQKQPEEAFAIVATVNKKTPAEVKEFMQTDKVLDLRDNRTAFTYATGIDSLHGNVRQISDFIIRQGLATKKVDSTEVLDDRFLRALK